MGISCAGSFKNQCYYLEFACLNLRNHTFEMPLLAYQISQISTLRMLECIGELRNLLGLGMAFGEF